jgi:hypothetical protein
MAASKEWTEWHLTPQGWQRGSEKTDFAPATKVQPPEDRVLTCVFRETIASSFGGFSRETDITWSSDDEQKIASLRQQFGDCPERL